MAALILVPAFAGILLALLPTARRQVAQGAGAYAILGAGIVFGLLLTISTEALSTVQALTFPALLIFWTVVAAATFLIARRARRRPAPKTDQDAATTALGGMEKLLLASLAVVAVITLSIALAAPPNTPDSLAYHMSRVMHWQQNRTVAFYPTPILRQLHMPPWAEYAILHCQILAGSDRLANLVQWTAMLGCLLAAYHITGLLGVERVGRLAAAVFAATIPMGILQASGTQNDYACALWLLTAVAFGLHLVRTSAPNRSLAGLFGGAVGLAMLTKATAYLYLFPFICWVAIATFLRHRRKAVLPLVAAGSIALLINLPHYIRNQTAFGSPIGTSDHGASELATQSYANQTHSLPAILSNGIRNAGLHLVTPSRFVNGWIERGIRRAHHVLGFPINDLRTTWIGTHYQTKPLSASEDEAANPLHFVLLLVAAVVVTVAACRQRSFACLAYTAAVAAGAFLFCLFLRWQPWHSRLHLPLFLAGAPIVGVALAGRKRLALMLMAVMSIASVPYLLCNESRPLCGRQSVLTTPRTDLLLRGEPAHASWHGAIAELAAKTHGDVWLVMNGERFEYPLWALAESHHDSNLRFRHANVPNVSATLGVCVDSIPEFALELAQTNASPQTIVIDGRPYRPTWRKQERNRQTWTVLYRRCESE